MLRFGVIPRCSGCVALILFALTMPGCWTSSLRESLQPRTGLRMYWHAQQDLSVGIGFREHDEKTTEIRVVLRNDGDRPVDVPALTPESVWFYVDGKRLIDKQAVKGAPQKLAPAKELVYLIKHRFVKGQRHRVFASVSMPGSSLPRKRAVSPEVQVSALFGNPPTYQASRWLED